MGHVQLQHNIASRTWGSNPFHHTLMWNVAATECLLELVGIRHLSQSLLLSGEKLGSICSGLGTDSIILENFIKVAINRSDIARVHGLKCRLCVVSSCDAALLVLNNSKGTIVSRYPSK